MLHVPLTYLGDSFRDDVVEALPPRRNRRLLALRIVMIIICLAMLFFLAVMPGRAQESNEEIVITIPAKNMKDQQQDDHLRYDDHRISALETLDARRDTQINDMENQMTMIRSYGAGAFGLLLVMQAIGVKMQFKAGKQTT